MLRCVSLFGIGFLALAAVALVSATKDVPEDSRPSEGPSNDRTDRRTALLISSATRYHARFSLN
jgi:hypothetical protein